MDNIQKLKNLFTKINSSSKQNSQLSDKSASLDKLNSYDSKQDGFNSNNTRKDNIFNLSGYDTFKNEYNDFFNLNGDKEDTDLEKKLLDIAENVDFDELTKDIQSEIDSNTLSDSFYLNEGEIIKDNNGKAYAISVKLTDKDGNVVGNVEYDLEGNIKSYDTVTLDELNLDKKDETVKNSALEELELYSSSKTTNAADKSDVEEVSETSAADQEKNIALLEKLNEKYNLNIDFNEELTEDQLNLLQQAYFIDVQKNTLDATEQSMLEYFDTLGILDDTYDAIKELFGSDVTKEKVQEYYENERQKNDLLVSIVKNGGSIPLDAETKALLTRLMGDEGAAKAAEIDLLNADGLSFEDAYKILKGVEYNPEIITQVMESQDSYALVTSEYQNAVAIENMMANSSPQEILEYFNKLAESQEGVTGEDLFNQYYKTFFEKYSDKMNTEDFNGMSCAGISVKDGYLWQEIAFPDGYDEETINMLAQSEFLYKDVDENGNVKYYKVVNLEDEHKLKSNINGKDEEFQVGGYANKKDDPTYANNPLAFFYKTNDSIRDNNLYLEKTKEDYNEVYGENAFDTIMEEYPKMYEEAFGKNELLDKLTEYSKDMDGYSKTISQVFSIGCFIASFIPGVRLAAWLPLLAAGSDNAIDLVNLATNKKDGEIGQWAADTLLEAGMIAIGMGINKFASKMGYKFTANQINNGNAFVMAHAKGVEAIVEYTVDNVASVIWDIGRGILDGSLVNEDGSFNWDYFQKMLVSDMIFNTADLRNGMSLYKSISGNSVDVAEGVKFTIDPDSSEVKFTYDDGYEITIGKNGKAVLNNPETGDSVDLTYNKSTKSWELPDGRKIDLTESNSALGKIYGSDNNAEEISVLDKLENDKDLKNNPELKQKVDELLEDETIKKFVDEGVLDEYNIKEMARCGAEVIDNTLKLLNDEDVLKLLENNKTNGNCLVSMARNAEIFDEVYGYLKNEKIYDLIENDKLLFIDFLEMRDGNPGCYEKLLKIVDSDVLANREIDSDQLYDLVQLDTNIIDRYLTILSSKANQGIFDSFNITDKDVLKLAELSDAEFNKFVDIMTGSDYNSKFIQKLWRNNPDFDIQKLTNVSQMSDSEIEQLVDLVRKDKSILSTGKTKNITEVSDADYDIVNKLFHGKRLDSSLEGYSAKVGGKEVAIDFDNNMVTEDYLKAHPEYKIDVNKSIVVTQEMMDSINAAIQELIDAGLEVPKNIRISDLFAPDSRLDGCKAAGYFSSKNPDAIYIRSDELSNADFFKSTILHETAHMNDFNGDGFDSDDSPYKINKQFSADGVSADDISEIISDYSLTNNQEFVAEVSVLLTNGTIVYNKTTGKYEIDGSEYVNAHGKKVKVTPDVIEKMNKIIEIYNKMTKGKIAKAKETE